jgi:hypothetical protein
LEKVHPLRRLVPRRVPHSLSAVRPVGRTGSLGFSSPQRHPLGEPRSRWVVHAPLSSALRFSQPLSGFPASSGFAALFRAAAVRGILPSESSPRRDRAPLSRPLAPLRLAARVRERRPADLVTAGFLGACARAHLLDSPRRLWTPFRGTRRRTSRSSWIRETELAPFRWPHPLRSLHPPASPFAPTRVTPGRWPILSWVLAPPEPSPSTPRNLGPARATRARTCPLTRRIGDTAGRTSQPLSPGETTPMCPYERTGLLSSTVTTPLEGGPHRLSTALLLPWPWELRADPSLLTFEASEYVESGVPPGRAPALVRSLTSSTSSRLRDRPRSGVIVSPQGWAPVSGHPSNLWTCEDPS